MKEFKIKIGEHVINYSSIGTATKPKNQAYTPINKVLIELALGYLKKTIVK